MRKIFLALFLLSAAAFSVVTSERVQGAFEKSQEQETIEAARTVLGDSLSVYINEGSGSGAVVSVGLSLPSSVFSVSGSPITSSGTLTGSLVSQPANSVFAGPSSGSGVPEFRSIVPGDISFLTDSATALRAYALARVHDTSSTLRGLIAAREPSITAGTTAQYWRGDKTWQTLPTSLPPSGSAGGDLTGSYPNPTLAAVGTAGTYRSVTTDSKGRVTSGTNPTTLAGYGITNAQPLDADLTAIAALSTQSYGRSLLTQADAAAARGLIEAARQEIVATGTSRRFDVATPYTMNIGTYQRVKLWLLQFSGQPRTVTIAPSGGGSLTLTLPTGVAYLDIVFDAYNYCTVQSNSASGTTFDYFPSGGSTSIGLSSDIPTGWTFTIVRSELS